MALPTTSLVLHLDAGVGVTTSGSDVTAWADQSGQSNDLSAVGAPQLVAPGLNGHPVISFDGTNDVLRLLSGITGLPTGAGDRTVYTVVKYIGVGYGGFAFGTAAVGQAFGLIVTPAGDLMVQGWGADEVTPTDGTGAGWLIQSAVIASNSGTHYKDDTSIDTFTRTYNTVISRIVLGAEIDETPKIEMDVATVLVYAKAHTAQERIDTMAYLNAKYFTTNTAPVLEAIGNQTETVGAAITPIVITWTDAESAVGSVLSAVNLPPGLTLSPTTDTSATISGTPTTDVGSPYTVEFTITDTGQLTDTEQITFVINAAPAGITLDDIDTDESVTVDQTGISITVGGDGFTI